jgi:hypothetical protein
MLTDDVDLLTNSMAKTPVSDVGGDTVNKHDEDSIQMELSQEVVGLHAGGLYKNSLRQN